MATIERPEVMESEMSEGSFSPSAPPRRASQNSALRSRSPPRYDSVMAQDQAVSEMNRAGRVGRRGFTESISHAGELPEPSKSLEPHSCACLLTLHFYTSGCMYSNSVKPLII